MAYKYDMLAGKGIAWLVDRIQGGVPDEQELLDALKTKLVCDHGKTDAAASKPVNQAHGMRTCESQAKVIILAGFDSTAQRELRQTTKTVFQMFEAARTYYHQENDIEAYQRWMHQYNGLKLKKGLDMMAPFFSDVLSMTEAIMDADPMNKGVTEMDRMLKISNGVKSRYPMVAKEITKEVKEKQRLVPPSLPTWRWLRVLCMNAEAEAQAEEEGSSDSDDVDEPEEKASAQVTKMSARARDAEIIKQSIEQGIAQGIKIALAMESKQPYADGGRGDRGSDKLKCKHCGKPNHTEDRCWSKHPEMKPEWARRRH
jgi:hypothetical protein